MTSNLKRIPIKATILISIGCLSTGYAYSAQGIFLDQYSQENITVEQRSRLKNLMNEGYFIDQNRRSEKEIEDIKAFFLTEIKANNKKQREVSSGRVHYDMLENHQVLQNTSIQSMISDAKEVAEKYIFPEKKVKLTTLQIVNSAPGSDHQIWHSDNKTQGITLVIPLVDINEKIGTTQLISRSHLLLSSLPFHYRVINPKLSRGSYLWMDCRVLHRGLANQLAIERPILVIRFDQEDCPPPGMNWLETVLRSYLGNAIYQISSKLSSSSSG